MRRPGYTRYTLRLDEPGEERVAAAATAPSREPEDDWSGVAPSAADAAALDYRHPGAVAVLQELQPAGWQEQDAGDTLVFWLEDGAESGETVAGLLRRLGSLGRLSVDREPPGWEDAWRRFHRPHEIGRLYVRPPWYPSRDGRLDIVVEAGLAFGTGGHASTRQCLELLQTLAPGSLLDLGSGSGVVSLAALRLGFAPVWGIDIDPVAVHAAAGNAAMNDLAPTFLVGDATDPGYPLPAADAVVANIALRPILRLAERWRAPGAGAAAPPPSELLLSGLLVEQAAEAAAAYPGYAEAARTGDGTWVTLHLRRRA